MSRDITARLREPRHPVRNTLLTIGGIAILGAAVFGANAVGQILPGDEPGIQQIAPSDTPEPSVTPTPTQTPSPEPTVEEPPAPAPAEPAPQPAPPSGPTLCPPGTVPGAVDDYGNESNCAPPCNAYDDNNVCVGAPSPGYREEYSA